jgi:quercetin dioxygenase-like cupin family protein
MKITPAADDPHIIKPEGTDVHYYLFPDYELHHNTQAAHTTQTWHHHEKIWETLYMIDGELTAHWREDGEEKSQVVTRGDVIETERSPHTFSNDSDETARFLVVKRIPSGEDHTETLKTDKVLD